MSRRNLVLTIIVITILIVSAFYLRSLVRRTFFENRVRPESEVRTQLTQQALQAESSARQTVTLYFPDFETGTLTTEARELALAPNSTDRIRQIVLALVEGSGQGHEYALPASTAVRGVFLTPGGTAYVDFSNDVSKDFPVGIQSETLAIYSVVDSIAANVSGVKRVKFLIQGQEVDTLDGHADLTGSYEPTDAVLASNPTP